MLDVGHALALAHLTLRSYVPAFRWSMQNALGVMYPFNEPWVRESVQTQYVVVASLNDTFRLL